MTSDLRRCQKGRSGFKVVDRRYGQHLGRIGPCPDSMSGKEVPVSIKRKYREFWQWQLQHRLSTVVARAINSRCQKTAINSMQVCYRQYEPGFQLLWLLIVCWSSKKYTFLFPRIGKIPENWINTWPRRSEIEIGDLELGWREDTNLPLFFLGNVSTARADQRRLRDGLKKQIACCSVVLYL